MASRRGPVHVVRNVRKHGDKVYESYLLRRSVRVGKKVEKKTLANLSHLPIELIDIIRRYLAGETFVGSKDLFEVQRNLPHVLMNPKILLLYRRFCHRSMGSICLE